MAGNLLDKPLKRPLILGDNIIIIALMLRVIGYVSCLDYPNLDGLITFFFPCF